MTGHLVREILSLNTELTQLKDFVTFGKQCSIKKLTTFVTVEKVLFTSSSVSIIKYRPSKYK